MVVALTLAGVAAVAIAYGLLERSRRHRRASSKIDVRVR